MQHFDFFSLFQEGILVSDQEDVTSLSKRIELLRTIPKISFDNHLFQIKSVYAKKEINKSMLPWFAAITKFEFEDSVVVPKIEMSSFAPKETLDHELIHAVRAPFEDSIYEEFLAFEFSKGLRKNLGPIFFDAWEGNILAISLLLSFFIPVLWFAALVLFLFFLTRLIVTRTIYKKGIQAISAFFQTDHPLSFALLFTQKEFEGFAKNQAQAVYHKIRTHQPLRYLQLLSLQKALCN